MLLGLGLYCFITQEIKRKKSDVTKGLSLKDKDGEMVVSTPLAV